MIDFNVLIPVFNTKPAALIEAVYSVLNQTIKQPYKVFLVNDGSTDMETVRALDYFRGIPNVNVCGYENNEGTSKALNYGHMVIESEYIALMGSDDISHKERFERQCAYLNGRKIDVLGTQLFGFKDDDITRKQMFKTSHPFAPTPNNTKNGWMVNHGTVMYRNQSVKDAGNYDPSKRRAQDVDLWPRMYAKGKVFVNLEETLYAWRRY